MAILTDGQQGLMLVSNKDTYSITNGTSLKVSLGNNNDIKLSTNMTSSVGVGITQALGPDVKIFGIPRIFRASFVDAGSTTDKFLTHLADLSNAQTYSTADEYKYVFSDGGKKDYFTKYLLHAEEDVNILTGYDGSKLSAKAANYAYSKYQTMTDWFHAGMFTLSVAANLAVILTARTLGGSDTEKRALLIASGASTAAIPIIGVIASKLLMESFKDTWKSAFQPNTVISANQKGFLYIGCRSLGNDIESSDCEDVSKLGALLGEHKHKNVISSISMDQAFRIEVAEDKRSFHQVEIKGGDKNNPKKPSKYYFGVDRSDGVIPNRVTNLEICPNSFYLKTRNTVLMELDTAGGKPMGELSLTQDANVNKSIAQVVAGQINFINRHKGNKVEIAEEELKKATDAFNASKVTVKQLKEEIEKLDYNIEVRYASQFHEAQQNLCKLEKAARVAEQLKANALHQKNEQKKILAQAKYDSAISDPIVSKKETEIRMNGIDGVKVAVSNNSRMQITKDRVYLGYKNAVDGKEWDDLCGVSIGFKAGEEKANYVALQYDKSTRIECNKSKLYVKFKDEIGYDQDASGVNILKKNLVIRP